MIIPITEEILYKIYYCPVCKNYYSAQTGNTRISCAVNHAPGTCCHYAEKEVTNEQMEQIAEILR